MLPVKNNLASESRGLAFRLAATEGVGAPHVEWSWGDVRTTADEALVAVRRRRAIDSPACGEAVEFLRQALEAGPRLVKDVEAEARERRGIHHDMVKRCAEDRWGSRRSERKLLVRGGCDYQKRAVRRNLASKNTHTCGTCGEKHGDFAGDSRGGENTCGTSGR